jgi:deoxycytidylate deaminase
MQSDHYKHIQKCCTLVQSRTNKNRMHRYVNLAKALFNKSACSNGRTFHCCFAVKKGKVLAIGINDYNRKIEGYNRRLKNTVKFYGEDTYHMSLHAEISALLKLGLEDCSGIEFYNVRLNKGCHCCHSAPCDNCLRMLTIVNAKRIYYYNEDMDICELNF